MEPLDGNIFIWKLPESLQGKENRRETLLAEKGAETKSGMKGRNF